MKRSKRIYILLGVLAAVCIATFCVMMTEENQEQIQNSGETILEIPSDSVTSLSWEYQDKTLAFHKNETWVYDDDEAFPVDDEKILALLEPFEELGASFIIEEPEDDSQYGLDKPVCTICIETEDETWEILLGSYSNMDSERYVSIGDGNVYLVKEDPMEVYDAALSDLIDHDETPEFEKATVIQFTGEENFTIVYEEDSEQTYRDDDVYFTRQEGETLVLDPARVDNYLDDISYLDLNDYVTYNATDDEVESCGLDDPDLTIAVDYTAKDEDGEEIEDTFILHLSRDPEEKAKAEKETKKSSDEDGEENEETITAYARVGESKIIYKITSSEYKELMEASCDAFRHTEVLPAEFEDVKKIDVSLEGEDYSITSKGKDDDRTWYYEGEELEIDDLKKALNNLKAESFTDEEPSKKEEIRLTVYLDKKDDPAVEILLYRYDGTHCLAVVDGEPVCLTQRGDAVDLIEAVQAIVLNE